MRTGEDEARAPKYAHVEREGRWLVDPAARPPLDGRVHVTIRDRYLDGTRCRLRLMTDSTSGAVARKLTKKYDAPDPTRRPIVTTYLTEAEYDLIVTLPARPLAKRRYAIEAGAAVWSLDVFDRPLAPLEIVEIECRDDAALDELVPPAWALREVSALIEWQSGALARHGRPEGGSQWPTS